jgi:hypothetical protein
MKTDSSPARQPKKEYLSMDARLQTLSFFSKGFLSFFRHIVCGQLVAALVGGNLTALAKMTYVERKEMCQ